MTVPRHHGSLLANDPQYLAGNFMDHTVVNWMGVKQKGLLLDYFNIKHAWNDYALAGLSDYSYLVTPAYKALEGVLIQVAQELGLPGPEWKVGAVFSDENLAKFYGDVLDRIQGLSREAKEDAQLWLNDVRRILKHFRHSPAHFLGEGQPNGNQAFLLGDRIVSNINELCLTLVRANLIGPGRVAIT